jgi:hypothetical protein
MNATLPHLGLCQEENPFFTIDEEGDIPLVCGLPRGHEGEHKDWRAVLLEERAKREEAEQLGAKLESERDTARHFEREERSRAIDDRNRADNLETRVHGLESALAHQIDVVITGERARGAALQVEGEEMDAIWHGEVSALKAEVERLRTDVEAAAVKLLESPINLIQGMKPTQEKQARDDMRYGMQKMWSVVRAALSQPALCSTAERRTSGAGDLCAYCSREAVTMDGTLIRTCQTHRSDRYDPTEEG